MKIRNTMIAAAICAATNARAGEVYMCRPCGAGTYSAEGAQSCTACGANSTSQVGSISAAACACNANYYGVDGNCTACPASSTTNGGTGKTGVRDCKCVGKAYMNSSNICTACDLAVNAAGTGCLTVPQITKADVASSLVAESLGNTSIQYSGSGNSTLPGGACKTGTLQPGIYRVVLGGGSGGDDYGNGPKGGKLTYNFMLKNPTAYRLCAGSDGNWRVGCGETGGGAGSYLKLTMNATDYYFAGGGGSGKDGSYGGGGGGGIGSGGACWKCSISGSGGVDGWGGVNSIGAIYSKNPSYNYSAANGGNGLDNNNGTPGFVQYCGGGGGGGGDASKGAGQDICLSYSSKRECTDGGSSCSDDSKTTIYTCTGAWIKSGRGSNITLHRLNQNGDAMADFTGRLGGSGGQAGKTTHDTNVSDPEPCDRCAKIFKFNI